MLPSVPVTKCAVLAEHSRAESGCVVEIAATYHAVWWKWEQEDGTKQRERKTSIENSL